MNDEKIFLTGSSSPHIRDNISTRILMLDMLIALFPSTAMAVYNYGLNAVLLIACSVIAAVLSEYLYCFFMHKKNSALDLSAAVTGLLLALTLPSSCSFLLGIIGSVFAIIICKMLFGGIGHNFVNPALAARAFLMASWPLQMTRFQVPWNEVERKIISSLPPATADIVSSATPLAIYKHIGQNPETASLIKDPLNMFLNFPAGTLGEASKAAILLGFAYLLIRKVISWEIPVFYMGSTVLLSWVFGPTSYFSGNALFVLLSGGLIFGAVFMASDYTTSPMTKSGQIIFAIGAGLVTFLIRNRGGYPEGVTYAILLMNLLVPFFDKWTVPRVFGHKKSLKIVGEKSEVAK